MLKFIAAALAAVVLGASVYFTNASLTVAEEVTLYKNPQCGCCEAHAVYLRDNGLTITVKPTHELVTMSRDAGIPDEFQGCHLAFIDD